MAPKSAGKIRSHTAGAEVPEIPSSFVGAATSTPTPMPPASELRRNGAAAAAAAGAGGSPPPGGHPSPQQQHLRPPGPSQSYRNGGVAPPPTHPIPVHGHAQGHFSAVRSVAGRSARLSVAQGAGGYGYGGFNQPDHSRHAADAVVDSVQRSMLAGANSTSQASTRIYSLQSKASRNLGDAFQQVCGTEPIPQHIYQTFDEHAQRCFVLEGIVEHLSRFQRAFDIDHMQSKSFLTLPGLMKGVKELEKELPFINGVIKQYYQFTMFEFSMQFQVYCNAYLFRPLRESESMLQRDMARAFDEVIEEMPDAFMPRDLELRQREIDRLEKRERELEEGLEALQDLATEYGFTFGDEHLDDATDAMMGDAEADEDEDIVFDMPEEHDDARLLILVAS